eukprot:g12477.t1
MGGAQSNAGLERDSDVGGARATDERARSSTAKNNTVAAADGSGQQQQQDEEAEAEDELDKEQQLELSRLRQRLLRPATLLPRPLQPEHEKDHALVLDLMEFFCYAVKPEPSFFGSMTFVFDQELDEDMEGGGDGRVKPELELSVTIQKVEPGDAGSNGGGQEVPPRPRVLVTLGGPPAGVEAKGRVRVPYEQFLLIYSGKASARDIASLAMHRKVELTGFAAFMQFGLSFDYRTDTWDGYYDIKSSLGAAAAATAEATAAGGVAEVQGAEGVGTFGDGAPGGDYVLDAARLAADAASDSGDVDGGGGGGGVSPTVLFSSDGFRELERYAAVARREQEEREALEEEEKERARQEIPKAVAAAPPGDRDSDGDSGSNSPRRGGSGSGGGGGGGESSEGGGGGGWAGRVAGWVRSLPGGGVFGGSARGQGGGKSCETPLDSEEGRGKGHARREERGVPAVLSSWAVPLPSSSLSSSGLFQGGFVDHGIFPGTPLILDGSRDALGGSAIDVLWGGSSGSGGGGVSGGGGATSQRHYGGVARLPALSAASSTAAAAAAVAFIGVSTIPNYYSASAAAAAAASCASPRRRGGAGTGRRATALAAALVAVALERVVGRASTSTSPPPATAAATTTTPSSSNSTAATRQHRDQQRRRQQQCHQGIEITTSSSSSSSSSSSNNNPSRAEDVGEEHLT